MTFVLVTVEDLPLNLDTPFTTQLPGDLEDLPSYDDHIELLSSKFSSWNDISIANIRKQVQIGLKTQEDSAESSSELYCEMDMKLGHNLGQIESLRSYKVVPLSEIHAFIDQTGMLESYKTSN